MRGKISIFLIVFSIFIIIFSNFIFAADIISTPQSALQASWGNNSTTERSKCPDASWTFVFITDDWDDVHQLDEKGSPPNVDNWFCLKSSYDISYQWALNGNCPSDWTATQLFDDEGVCEMNEDNHEPKDVSYYLCLNSSVPIQAIWNATCPQGWINTKISDCDFGDGHDCNEDSCKGGGGSGYLCLYQPRIRGVANNAECGTNNIPTRMVIGKTKTVFVDVLRTGDKEWSKADGYKLKLVENDVWGVTEVDKVCNVNLSLCPSTPTVDLKNETQVPNAPYWYRFWFNITAPTTLGYYNNTWRMAKNTEFFGETCGREIYVTPPFQPVIGVCNITRTENCSVTNRIMGFSDFIEAHAQVGRAYQRAINYPYVLCCGGDSVNCTGKNTIVKLSNLTDVHAQIPENATGRTLTLTKVERTKLISPYWACLNSSSYHYQYCINNSLPILNTNQQNHKFNETTISVNIKPNLQKAYLTLANGKNISIDDKIVVTISNRTSEFYTLDRVATYIGKPDIKNLLPTQGGNVSINIKLYDVYSDMVENTEIYFEQQYTEQVQISNYPVNVCYGNLECRSETQNNLCNADETLLFSLSDISDAHIAIGNYANYPIKICCKKVAIVIPNVTGNAYWVNMLDTPINKTQIGDSVKLIASIANISAGKYKITYSIYKISGSAIVRLIRNILNAISGPSARISTRGSAVWRANETGFFYFKAEIVELGKVIDSRDTTIFGVLEVISPENNAMPHAEIVKPLERSKHLINTQIDFKQASYDEDDDLNIEWYYGDGQSITFSGCLSGINCNTTHSYITHGTKNIRLKAVEKERWQEANDYKMIFVYSQGINLFPIITEPEINEEIVGGETRFNGSESYVANCTTNLGTCYAHSGISCYNVTNESGNPVLTCYDLPKTDDWLKGANKKYILYFNWTVETRTGAIVFNRFGDWANNYNNAVEFTQNLNPGQYIVKLKIGYEPISA